MPTSSTICALYRIAGQLLARAGFPGKFDLALLPGGANNRVARLQWNDRHFLLKVYFQHPHDRRNRLNAEFAFLCYAWNHGIRCVPRPYAIAHDKHAALYEFVEGRPVRGADVSGSCVRQASAFFQQLNSYRNSTDAAHLPLASESCFSMQEHIGCIARRMARLSLIKGRGQWDRQAVRFIRTRLTPAWQAVSNAVDDQLRRLPAACARVMKFNARRLSPSDFGFHNAILTRDQPIHFIDFEYAGWDDPAKTVCDFFCQVAVPVPWSYMPQFTTMVLADQSKPERQIIRAKIRLLLPLYQIKWCCILLNDFLPIEASRRRFAQGTDHRHERKAAQLTKAGVLLDRLVSPEETPL